MIVEAEKVTVKTAKIVAVTLLSPLLSPVSI